MSSWLHTLGIDLDRSDWLDRLRRAETQAALGMLGEYELIEEIGRGGQGIVYRARRNGRVVALKRLLGGSPASASVQRRFEREIEAVRSLTHAGIVRTLGVEQIDGQPLLVMEWIDGRPITEWAAGRPATEIVEVVRRTGEALLHAHQRGVIHRDLKPSNILVDAHGRPHLLDFGLAKLTGPRAASTVTTSGQFLGTLAYASPEHVLCDASSVDARSDLYALGVILYEMLTGRMPYALGESAPSVIHAITTVEPKRPRSTTPRVDRSLEAIMLQTLMKRPDDRYQSVDAFLSDLTRYRDGEPVEAKGPNVWHVAQRLVRRHPTASSIAGGLGLLVLTFAVTMAALYHRAERAVLHGERVQAALEASLASSPSPSSTWDIDAVVDELERTAARLDTDLEDEPELELRLRNRVAQRYAALGRWTDVSVNAQRALQLSRDIHAEDGPQYAWSLHLAGLATLASDSVGRGTRLLDRAIEIYTARFGEAHPFVADVMVSRAYVEWAAVEEPDFRSAADRYERALEIFDHAEPPAPAMHARGLERYGDMLRASGDGASAAAMYAVAIRTYASMETPPVRRVAACYQRYADLLRWSGRHEESEDAYRRAIELRGGEVDPALPPCHANLGNSLFSRGHYDEALVSYRDAIISRCHQLSMQLPEHRREFLRHAANVEDGLDPDEVDGLWQSLREAAPHIVPLLQFTAGRIAETWRRLGDEPRAAAIEQRIDRNDAQDKRASTPPPG